MYNKIVIIVLFSIGVLILSGCGKDKTEESVNVEYEHNVLETKPSPSASPTPTIPIQEGDDNTNKDNITNNDNENNQPNTGVFEIDGMKFTSVNDMVKVVALTANLRTGPSTNSGKVTLSKAGDTFTRTAIGDGGWDQLQYQGETVYIWNEFIIKIETVNKVDAREMEYWRFMTLI